MDRSKSRYLLTKNYEAILMTDAQRDFVAKGGKLEIPKMDEYEEQWALAFEALEYAVKRSRMVDARLALADLGVPEPTEQLIAQLNESMQVIRRCNPVRAEKDVANKQANKKTSRTQLDRVYDPTDWIDTSFETKTLKDVLYSSELTPACPRTSQGDGGFQSLPGLNPDQTNVTTSPEDAIVEALDAARVHKVDLDTFLNTPSLWAHNFSSGRSKKASTSGYKPPADSLLTVVGMVAVRRAGKSISYKLVFLGPYTEEWVHDRHLIVRLQDYLDRALQDSHATHALVRYEDRIDEYGLGRNDKSHNYDYPRAQRVRITPKQGILAQRF